MNENLEKIQIIVLAFFAIVMVWFLGSNQIIQMNQAAGMKALTYSHGLLFSLLYVVASFYIYLKAKLNSPQGILIGILLFYSYIWFFAFYSVSGFTEARSVFLGGLVLFIPILLLILSAKYLKVNYELLDLRNRSIKVRVEFVITLLLILVSILMYEKMGISFTFIDSYDRRMLAREEVNGFLAYYFSMCLNGFAPLLAFLAIYNRKYFYLIVAFTFVLLGFGFIGTKAPIAYALLMAMIGFYFSRGGNNIVFVLVLAMTGLIFLALLEFLYFGFSWIADIYVRRAILVVPQLQMYFIDFIFNRPDSTFSLLTGSERVTPITFVIGEVYTGNPETNANTISFLTELGRKGILGYLFNVFFLLVFYNLLAHLYKVSRHKVWLAISTLYALLLLEQSYSTALVSSGIAISTFMLVLFNYQREKN